VELEGSKTLQIPALGDFKILDVKVIQSPEHPEQYVVLQFSDPVLENQNLSGLISISQWECSNGLKYIIEVEDNEIRVYHPDRRVLSPPFRFQATNKHTVFVEAAVKNIFDMPLKEKYSMILFKGITSKSSIDLLLDDPYGDM
jgi:hypothetical protein